VFFAKGPLDITANVLAVLNTKPATLPASPPASAAPAKLPASPPASAAPAKPAGSNK
jgi:hypothetical protein